jgi:hypothetical protein
MIKSIAAKVFPAAVMTIGIAQWVSSVLGTAGPKPMVIAFAWAIATGHQLLSSRRTERLQELRWSADSVVGAIGGQILWVVLPYLQFTYPDAWFCAPIAIPPALTAMGAVVAVYWPLRPFVTRLRAKEAAVRDVEFDGCVLYTCFFVLSGNLVFAAGTCASVLAHWAGRMSWRRTAVGYSAI